MAIDDLLQQVDQNRARQGYGPRKPSTLAADADVRANAQRLRTQGLLPGGERPSAAARTVTSARPTPSIAEPPPSASATAVPETAAARGGTLSRVAQGAGRVAAPAVLGLSAAETGSTPTEAYYERFGIEPRNDGTILGDFLPNLGIRALGAASDLGNTLTGGLAGDMFFRDRQSFRPERATTRQAAATSPEVFAPNEPSAQPSGRIYRLGNQYSDQPIAGGVEFDPRAARGGFAVSTSGHVPNAAARMRGVVNVQELDRAQRLADRDERVQRQRDDFNNVQMQRTITGGTPDPVFGATAASQAANERRATLRLLQDAAKGRHGVSARGQREALASLAERTKGGYQQARPELAPGVDRSPVSPIDLLRSQSQGAIEDEQGIAAGFVNQQARRTQQIMEQLQQIGANTSSDERRALIDRALVSQGKDPDANRYEAIEAIGGLDAMGNPIKTRSLYDTRSGQIIGGAPATAPAVGQQQQQVQYQEGTVYTDAQGNRARYESGKFVPLN